MSASYQVEIYNPDNAQTYDATAKALVFQTTEDLDKPILDFRVSARGILDVHLFHRMTIKKNGSTILSGVIVDQAERQSNGDKSTAFTCQNKGYYAMKRIVAETYRSKTASYILTHLINKYFPEVSTTTIKPSTDVLKEVKFTYITLGDAIQYIMDLMPGWRYYIDSQDRFHFFFKTDGTGTTIIHNMLALDSLGVDYEGIDHYNRVWIVGNKEAAPTAIDVFYTSDGSQKYFGPLPYEPASLKIYIKPDGLPEYQLTVGAEGASGEFEAVYNAKQRVFYLKDPATTPGKLRANFKPVRQFIDYYENVADIQKYGLMERAVKNKDVTNQAETRRYGRAQVQESSRTKRILRFNSDHASILNAALGEKRVVSIVTDLWNITGNFIVRRIGRDVSASRDKKEIISIELEELLT